MCRKMISLVSLVLLLGLSSTALATTYYVSPSGNDNNSGTSPEQAWQTTDKVNSMTFSAGDSILFEGGQTFSGGLLFDVNDGGTPTAPLTVGSYGTGGDGRATISSGSSDGFYAPDRAAFVIKDLHFVGSGSGDDTGGHGILFYTEVSTGEKFEYIRIDNVVVGGYYQRGICIGGWHDSMCGYKNVRITNCEVYDIGDIAIFTFGYQPPTTPANLDIYVGNCKTYDNPGIPGKSPHSGNGIIVSGVDGAIVEFCESYNNGWLHDFSGGGPVGIWCYEANNVVIQFCESHHTKTQGGDGGGFDIDGGSTNCNMQYNYAHDNYGPGYQFAQYQGATAMKDNVCRYNISNNDGQVAKDPTGGLALWGNASSGGLQDSAIYGNTFYAGPNTTGGAIHIHTGEIYRASYHNNIFLTEPDKRILQLGLKGEAVEHTFQGNCYWSSGSPLEIKWRVKKYTSLADWRAATGQEMLDGQPVGYETDPKLVNPGGGNDYDYMLQDTSPMIDAGLDYALFGIDPGPQDYFGTSIPQGSAYDVGAHECVAGPPDTDPPTPDPMTWATVPYATGTSSIAMVATTATDPSGVEYYFDCTTTGGHDSSWQDSTSYEDTGLDPSTQYCYKVQARDKSANQNETGWSTTKCATTQEPGADIYVYDIAMSWYEPKGGYYAAKATVWIKDVSLNDISGATVTGEWSGATTSGDTSGDTGTDGKVTLESKAVKGGGTYTFTVTDVSATGYTYNPLLNNMDSNSITAP